MPITRPLPLLLSCLLVLAALAAGAHAQPGSAKEHFAAAQEHFDAGRYLEAAAGYEAAYAAAPDKHALLYNIGLAYHRAGRVADALDNYELYLERDPQGAAVEEVRDYVTQFRALLGRDEPEEPAPSPPPAVGSEPEPEPELEPAPAHEEPRPLVSKPAEPDRPMSKLERRGWLVGGTGLALMLAGAGTGYWARSTEDEVEDIYNGGRSFPDGKNRKGTWLSRVTIGLTSVGGAALLGGAFLVWRGRSREAEPAGALALTPILGTDGSFGMGAAGRF